MHFSAYAMHTAYVFFSICVPSSTCEAEAFNLDRDMNNRDNKRDYKRENKRENTEGRHSNGAQ